MNDSRAEFEAMVKDRFECTEFSLARTSDGRYYNSVGSLTFDGRVQPDYASVDMLWKAWQASRAQPERKPMPNCCDTPNYCSASRRCTAQDVAKQETKLSDDAILALADKHLQRYITGAEEYWALPYMMIIFARALLAAQPAVTDQS